MSLDHGASNIESLFAGTAMAATSFGITAQVLAFAGGLSHGGVNVFQLATTAAIFIFVLGAVPPKVEKRRKGVELQFALALALALDINYRRRRRRQIHRLRPRCRHGGSTNRMASLLA